MDFPKENKHKSVNFNEDLTEKEKLQMGICLGDFLMFKDGFNCDKYKEKRKSIDFRNWLVKKIIGKGAYAKVYLITHCLPESSEPPKFYAMKVIQKSKLMSSDMSELTMQERSLLLEMQFPYILNLHYAFQTEYQLYLVLDFVNGGDLF